MLGIIICDDDRFMLGVSEKTARRCAGETGRKAEVVCATAEYAEVLRFAEKNPGARLYFLDIDFGKAALNGVDIARLIKKREPRSKIVFVTSHADLGLSVLKSGVEAFGFIEKTTDEKKLAAQYKKYIALALESAGETGGAESEDGHIKLLVGIDEYVSFPVSRILYVEADKSVSHFIRYRTVDGSSVSVRGTIEEALASLGNNFMKSHRSVIINKNMAVSVSNGLVKFAGGETAACSFRLKNEVERQCRARGE